MDTGHRGPGETVKAGAAIADITKLQAFKATVVRVFEAADGK